MSPSAREIVELNIEYYRKKLEMETDPSTRRTIAKLLQEEEVKFRELTASVSIRKALPPLPSLASGTD